jgi:thymidylate synthase (FAD)
VTLPDGYIQVLDKGYVGLLNHMGSDASIISAARVSFDKECVPNEDGTLAEKDQRLMAYLVRKNEMSVFRQATVQFEIYMPLMVARQYWKYIVGAAHIDDGVCMNETSRRYVTEEPTFYIPELDQWRSAPENSKQGSGEPIDPRLGEIATQSLMDMIDQGVSNYEYWMGLGVCAEQARLFLPAYGMYVRVRTTMSLAALIHLLKERLGHGAQAEFTEYAKALRDLTAPLFPVTFATVFGG